MSIKLTSAETARNRSSLAAAVGSSDKIDIASFTSTYIKNTPAGWSNVSVGAVDTTYASAISSSVQIDNIYVTDSSFNILDDTAISTSGGYLKILGAGFQSGCVVYIQGVAASSVSFVNSSELRVIVPAISSGTLQVYVVNPNNSVAIRISGIVASGVPNWVTTSPLSDTLSDTAFSIQLSATSDSTIAYSLQAGSSLPSGTSLSSSGLFSGTVTGIITPTAYSFTVVATDLELQDTAKVFSITITVGDANFYRTQLVIPADANTWVTDASSNNTQILTIGNDTKPVGISPYNYNWSNYFDGTGDSLTATSSTAFAFGTGTYTVEAWVYPTAVPANAGVVFDAGSTTGSFGFYLMNTTRQVFVNTYGTGTLSTLITPSGIPLNQWTHIAVCRSSTATNDTKIYVNGVLSATGTDTTNWTVTTTPQVGYDGAGSGYYFNGYISNLRVVKGTAVYTGNFTVPTSILTTTQSASTNIAEISGTSTSLLTCQSNRLVDNSTANSGTSFTVTRNGDVFPKSFGPFIETDLITGSAYFDGTGDYLVYPDSENMELGSGDFCVECWICPTSVSATGVIIDKRVSSYGPLLLWRSGSTLVVYMSSNGSSWNMVNGSIISNPIPGGAVIVNTWYHVAIYRVSGVIYAAVNGTVSVLNASNTSAPNNNAGNWFIGTETNASTNPYTGYISNLRFVVGSGVYTSSNFTPPTTQLTATDNTKLLTLQNRKGENNYRFVDDSPARSVITRNGDATQGTFTPFSADEGYWCQYYPLNAQRTYMTANTSILDVKSTGTWTVEGWVKIEGQAGAASAGAIFVSTTDFSTTVNWFIGVDSTTNKPLIYWYTGSVVTCLGSTVLQGGQWYFLQFTSNNGALGIAVNGVAETLTGTTTMGNPGNTTYFALGCERTYNHPAYLYDLRISNSVRSYTLPTTPLTTDSNTKLLTLRRRTNIDESSLGTALTNVSLSRPDSPYGFRVTTRVPYSPELHGGSVYLDGTGDYLNLDGNSLLAFGTQDFSIEFWLYFTALDNNNHIIYDSRPGADGAYPVIYVTNNTLIYYVSSASRIQTGATITAGQWYHIAVSRVSSNTRMFLNGTLVNYWADTTTYLNGASRPTIGVAGSPLGSYTVQGYMSGLRVQKGNGVTSMTVPTAPPTMTANTVLLENFTNAPIIDVTGHNDITTGGTGIVRIGSRGKFANSSMFFSGSYQWAFIGNGTPPLLPPLGDYTVECWVYCITGDSTLMCLNTTSAVVTACRIGLNAAGTVTYYVSTPGTTNIISTTSGAGTFALNQWKHIAIVRYGGTHSVYVDGTSVIASTTIANTTAVVSGTESVLGCIDNRTNSDFASFYGGYIDDFRVSHFARYTGNFTPPTEPLPIR